MRLKPFAIGLVIDAALVFTGVLSVIIYNAATYNGRCSDLTMMSGNTHACSFPAYVAGESFLTLFVVALAFWWLYLPVLIVVPLVVSAVRNFKKSKPVQR